jgi:hypothetical protein
MFENAWTLAGPIYCKKYNMEFVPFNKAEIQKLSATLPDVHYIFALDSSGSMQKRWNGLMKCFKETV